MKLTTPELEQLFEALLDGYKDYDQLKIMVKYKLQKNLAEISQKTNTEVTVFELIEWAEKSNKILDLILGAYEKNPDNIALKTITVQLLKRVIENEIDVVRDDLKEKFFEVVNKLNIKKE